MKTGIRAEMRKRRRAVSAEVRAVASHGLCARLLEHEAVVAAIAAKRPIMVYFATPDEPDLSEFVTAALERGAVLAAPRWNGVTYEPTLFRSLAELGEGPHGITEPIECSPAANVAVWLVPGLAFTANGRRLGHGGGWYDRLLSGAEAGAVRLGVGYDFQVVGDLPQEPHDQLLDEIITA